MEDQTSRIKKFWDRFQECTDKLSRSEANIFIMGVALIIGFGVPASIIYILEKINIKGPWGAGAILAVFGLLFLKTLFKFLKHWKSSR